MIGPKAGVYTMFDAYFEGLKGKKIAVLGLGVSNRPLVGLLLEFGCDVTGCDRTPREKLDKEVLDLEARGCKLNLGEHYLEGIEADVVFRTPGMHPGNPGIQALAQKGAKITSEMEVFFEVCPCRIIAVTGSDGKTTTTSLIAAMLEAAGKKVWVGGNIGTPLLPRCREIGTDDLAVVELSSFQLMDMERSPQVAVVTNLAPNHLDVHRDMEEYTEAKKNIFRYQNTGDLLILNADNAITDAFEGMAQIRKFSRAGKDVYCRMEEENILCGGRKVMTVGDILLPGVHNIENYMAAMLAVEGIVEDETIRAVARTFGGVEHRIELVRQKDGVKFYNDSIASSPSRTIAGLRSFSQPVILIAGGYDKNLSYEELAPEIVKSVKELFLCGPTGPKIRDAVKALAGGPDITLCEDFDDAVRRAAKAAVDGDVVLMSPASASFDRFKNFMERGNHFKKLVEEL